MGTDNALVFGIILIVIGVAFALLAYAAVIAMRGRESGESEPGEGEATAEPDADVQSEPVEAEEGGQMEVAVEVPAEEIPPPASPDPGPAASIAATARPAAPDRTPRPAAGRIHVASLLRDEVTGRLLLEVQGEEFTRPEDLRASRHWNRLERAISDLNYWVEGSKASEALPVTKTEEAEEKEVRSGQGTMIQQIDSILARKLEEAGRGVRGVRLMEGLGGAVKVYIGVQSYPIEEVPDPEIRNLIREAVAEWEGSQ